LNRLFSTWMRADKLLRPFAPLSRSRSPSAFSHTPLLNPQKPHKPKQSASCQIFAAHSPVKSLVKHSSRTRKADAKLPAFSGAIVTAEGLKRWLSERLMMHACPGSRRNINHFTALPAHRPPFPQPPSPFRRSSPTQLSDPP